MTRPSVPDTILRTLARASMGAIALACACSLVAGAASTTIVALVNAALHDPSAMPGRRVTAFVLLALAACAAQAAARVLFARLGQRSLATMRSMIAARVQGASFPDLQEIGSQHVQALVTEDANQIANLLVALPTFITNAAIVCATLAYLAWLSVPLFCVALVLIMLGSGGYWLLQARVTAHFAAAGQEQDRMFRHFASLTLGAKELRLNRGKARRLLDEVLPAAIRAFARHRGSGFTTLALATGWGEVLFYGLLGATLFLPWLASPEPVVTSGYVVALIYVIGPLQTLLSLLPLIGLARVAAQRIDAAFADLAAEPLGRSGRRAATATISLSRVFRRSYDPEGDRRFDLGPIDLVLRPGQVSFVIGGNGSGKTTLARVVAGLYAPDSGKMSLNGETVTGDNRESYRQHVSAVFSDFHLFETLLERRDVAPEARAWLRRLGLEGVVDLAEGAFSTQRLSTGQRKRLALVVACLEDRPIMIFDEWAADQDPEFQKTFYDEILPELRESGKTLLVITHDDRYFGQADQVIKLEHGTTMRPTEATSEIRC